MGFEISVTDIALLFAIIVNWLTMALRDKKVDKEEWLDLASMVANKLVDVVDSIELDENQGRKVKLRTNDFKRPKRVKEKGNE